MAEGSMNNQLERIWKWMLSNVRYICLNRLRFNIWTRHIQHTSQKHCTNQLAQFLSVKWTHTHVYSQKLHLNGLLSRCL